MAQKSYGLWENFKQIVIVVLLFVVVKTTVVEAYKIPSQSMEDTLLVGDFLLANKLIYGAEIPILGWKLPAISDPEKGDVIIFIYPRDGVTKYIKRCVGTPGDTVLVRDKVLYVNGKEWPNPEFAKYIDTTDTGKKVIQPRRPGGADSRDNFGPYVVPPDQFFMMGDNRDNSHDSRWWGPVPRKLILGQAMIVHWSWDDARFPSPEVSVTDPLSVPRVFIHNAVHFFQKVRWNRILGLIS